MSFSPWKRTVTNDVGNIVPSASVEVRRTADNSLASLFSDAGTTPITNPFQASAVTAEAEFYAQPDRYTVSISLGGDSTTEVIDLVDSRENLTFPTRASFVSWVSGGGISPVGTVITDGTVSYRYQQGATVISDLLNWVPFSSVSPEHWAVNTTPGTTDMQAAVVSAFSYANTNDLTVIALSEYLTTASVPNFHTARKDGPGSYRRGTDVWRANPAGVETNIVYVDNSNLASNDGLSSSQSTTILQAFNIMRGIGDKAQDGTWRIQITSDLTSSGVTPTDLPAFRNRLEIWGMAANNQSVPTTVWDGAAATQNYAIRIDWSYPSSNVFLHFKDIKFENWNNTSLSGGIVVWASGNVLADNIHTNNCSIGDWYRQCYVRATNGRRDNAATYGTGIQYGASGNVGDLSGGGVTYTNCGECINTGRSSTCYIQGSDLSGDVLIGVSRNGRIRTQGNQFRAWTNSVVFAQAVGVWTPDNSQGSPDTYIMTPTEAAPVFRAESGSVHSLIQRLSGDRHTYNSGATFATVTGASGTQTLLSALPGVSDGDFVPFRLPNWALYSPSFIMRVEIQFTLTANSGGLFTMNGSSASSILGSINIPTNASARSGKIIMDVTNRAGVSTGRYSCQAFLSTGVLVSVGSTASLNSSAIRSASEAVNNFRLYFTPSSNDTVTITDMNTYFWV